jgi:hypothetical protein
MNATITMTNAGPAAVVDDHVTFTYPNAAFSPEAAIEPAEITVAVADPTTTIVDWLSPDTTGALDVTAGGQLDVTAVVTAAATGVNLPGAEPAYLPLTLATPADVQLPVVNKTDRESLRDDLIALHDRALHLANQAAEAVGIEVNYSAPRSAHPDPDSVGIDPTTTYVDDSGQVVPLSDVISDTVDAVATTSATVSQVKIQQLADHLRASLSPLHPKKSKKDKPKPSAAPRQPSPAVQDPRLAVLLGGFSGRAVNPEVVRARPLTQEGEDHVNIGTGPWYMRLLDLNSAVLTRPAHKPKDKDKPVPAAARKVIPMVHSAFGEFACPAGLVAFLKDKAAYDNTGEMAWAANWRELHGSKLRAATKRARAEGRTIEVEGLQLVAAWFMWQRVASTPLLAKALADTGTLPVTMYYTLETTGARQHQAYEADWYIDVIREIRDVCIANQGGGTAVPTFEWLSAEAKY